MLDLAACITQLEQQAQTINTLVAGVDDTQVRWKPDAESWSILEVMNHLYEEERDDFRTRLKHLLEAKDGLPPAIDPAAWVTERGYNQRDLHTSLANFLAEREQSLEWLRGLTSPNWDNAVELPFGRLRAGDVLMAWVAHDLLHLRQLLELHHAYLAQQAKPYQIVYAGDW